ncbi:hypothetical protein KM043_012699 [Ampulex compressa]|nr:hypothetical protein KM043_012699 [Ampulex compressa]
MSNDPAEGCPRFMGYPNRKEVVGPRRFTEEENKSGSESRAIDIERKAPEGIRDTGCAKVADETGIKRTEIWDISLGTAVARSHWSSGSFEKEPKRFRAFGKIGEVFSSVNCDIRGKGEAKDQRRPQDRRGRHVRKGGRSGAKGNKSEKGEWRKILQSAATVQA